MSRNLFAAFSALCLLCQLLAPVSAADAPADPNATIPGELLVDNPTIHHLAFRWLISGDANGNAAVRVKYRRRGQDEWRAALPMLRVRDWPGNAEKRLPGCGPMLAGSVLNLQPATAYEVAFELSDPDGGSASRTVTVSTRAEPRENLAGKRQVHVYPAGHAGPRHEPSFADLAAAFQQAQPGDLVLLHAGTYAGSFRVAAAGTADWPVIYRAAGDGEVIIDGGGNNGESIIEIEPDRGHLYFEGLTIRGGRVALRGTRSDGIVVRRCSVYDVDYGISCGTTAPGVFENTNWYVADNVLVGRYKTWRKRTNDLFGAGINLPGKGHVACYNRVSFFWDGISLSHANFRVLTARPDEPHSTQHSIDVYNNDVSAAVDDAIEADHLSCNIRIMRNRLMNSLVGISLQPCLAGPAYVTHNVASNFTSGPWKLHVYFSGLMLYHNTTISASGSIYQAEPPLWNSQARNNILVGAGGAKWSSPSEGPFRTSLDYNGYGTPRQGPVIRWSLDGDKTFVPYASLADFTQATGNEAHGKVFDVERCFLGPVILDHKRDYEPRELDLRLRDDSPAVDAGVVLPTINDGFTGEAPDLGAYELGQPVPHYGPRPAR